MNSAKGFSDKDNSEKALLARKISSFGDLNELEFIARIDIETDANDNQRNIIKTAIDTSHKDYAKFMTSSGDIPGWM